MFERDMSVHACTIVQIRTHLHLKFCKFRVESSKEAVVDAS